MSSGGAGGGAGTAAAGGVTVKALTAAIPPLVVGGAVSYVAVRGIAATVNGIMNMLNLGGSNAAGTTENATMLNPN